LANTVVQFSTKKSKNEVTFFWQNTKQNLTNLLKVKSILTLEHAQKHKVKQQD